jgi:predicted ATPase
VRLHGTEAFQQFVRECGYDGGLYGHAYLAVSLWHLGFPESAEAVRLQMEPIAEATGNPYSVLLALGFGGMLACESGDAEAALVRSSRMISLATEQHIPFWLAGGNCEHGGALLLRGDAEAAIPHIKQGLDIYRAIGVRVSYSYFLRYLAEAYRVAGKTAEGLATVEEGLALCEATVARFHQADMWRLKGELLLQQGDMEAADAGLRRALEIAQQQRAKSLELRAAMSLARALRERRRLDEARTLLGEVFAWFSEGFETRDLRLASALLAELL